jgi:ubiquitin-activating enzyme E1
VGAFASAEALKAATGVFTPLQQWLYLDVSDAAQNDEASASAPDAAAVDDRTVVHAAAFGPAALNALAALRLLLVGAGGVGGEALKNFALLGVGKAAAGGSITVADDATVTAANLSRGVLLRATDIGRSKAEAVSARAAALALRPTVQHMMARVTSDGLSGALTDDALAQFGVVAAAVNSFSSRLALDERCVRARVAWVDAGVDGPLAHVQPVAPFASVPWSAGARDASVREAPSCVLRNFPFLPWHTVDWARAQFDALYHAAPAEVNAYLSKRDYLEVLAKKPATTRLHALRALGESLVHHRPVSLQACVAWARATFDELFYAAPRALLTAFPPGAAAPDGAPFWCAASPAPWHLLPAASRC